MPGEEAPEDETPMDLGDLRYFAFISYSSQDWKFARWLQRRIESFRLPTRLREENELRQKSAETKR